jgi:HEPN domain-containing protein
MSAAREVKTQVRPEVIEVLQRFVSRGDRHLDAAVVLVRAGSDSVADAACYHCEEAVDKYIKAILTLHNIAAPRTHDLNYIHNLLPPESRLSLSAGDLIYLSTYGIERWWDPDHSQAARALEIALKAQQLVRDALARCL